MNGLVDGDFNEDFCGGKDVITCMEGEKHYENLEKRRSDSLVFILIVIVFVFILSSSKLHL